MLLSDGAETLFLLVALALLAFGFFFPILIAISLSAKIGKEMSLPVMCFPRRTSSVTDSPDFWELLKKSSRSKRITTSLAVWLQKYPGNSGVLRTFDFVWEVKIGSLLLNIV